MFTRYTFPTQADAIGFQRAASRDLGLRAHIDGRTVAVVSVADLSSLAAIHNGRVSA